MKKTSTNPKTSAEWIRGYKKHTLWIGNHKKAEIILQATDSHKVQYEWKCIGANMTGIAQSFDLAKRTVQSIVLSNVAQLDLFDIDTN